MAAKMKPVFFRNAAEFRRWLTRHHGDQPELQVGVYRKDSGRGGLTYAEAVDEALCFGWIDGVTHKIDDVSFSLRFTPRRARSNWSLKNVRNVERLIKAKKMHAAGLKAFAAREDKRTGVYSFEQAPRSMPPAYENEFRANPAAWEFFEAQAPGYRRLLVHKVVSPKREETRRRWLARLISESAAGRRVQ
jgi:uncharacterized protein YdeI (YjbR/CyaY-like superfamily)